jgi:hypothetical protein
MRNVIGGAALTEADPDVLTRRLEGLFRGLTEP